ncbi:MAG: sulfatase [Sedimentisphaeraceae bacterium JB056]
MNRRDFLKIAGGSAAAFSLGGCLENNMISGGKKKKPNIVLIMADDVGYGDLGCYGDTNLVPTPNIDKLASQGVRFSDAYVTAPVCGPCRYGMFLGAYQQKFGIQWNWSCWSKIPGYPNETIDDTRIPSQQELMTEPLEDAGYVSGLVGHWGLPCYPQTSFDESMSVIHYVADYWPDETGHYGGVDEDIAYGEFKDIKWGPEREGDEYLTDRLGRQAVEFIDRHKDEPFFLYLGFNAPHSPMQAKNSLKDKVAHLPSEALKFYGAMLLSMDENVGKVVEALDERGLREDTIVVFISDNGPTYAYNVKWPKEWPKELLGSAGELRGYKGQFLEGGIRIPLIMSWPGQLENGSVYEKPVSALDFYPTFCNAAGAEVPSGTHLDGVDLMPYLKGKKDGSPHDILFWYSDDRGAVRKGRWKLYVNRDVVRLCDLKNDIGETTDLSSEYPQVRDALLKEFEEFRNSMPAPLNPDLYEEHKDAFIKEYQIFSESGE